MEILQREWEVKFVSILKEFVKAEIGYFLCFNLTNLCAPVFASVMCQRCCEGAIYQSWRGNPLFICIFLGSDFRKQKECK